MDHDPNEVEAPAEEPGAGSTADAAPATASTRKPGARLEKLRRERDEYKRQVQELRAQLLARLPGVGAGAGGAPPGKVLWTRRATRSCAWPSGIWCASSAAWAAPRWAGCCAASPATAGCGSAGCAKAEGASAGPVVCWPSPLRPALTAASASPADAGEAFVVHLTP